MGGNITAGEQSGLMFLLLPTPVWSCSSLLCLGGGGNCLAQNENIGLINYPPSKEYSPTFLFLLSPIPVLCLPFSCLGYYNHSRGFKCLTWSPEKPKHKGFESVGEKREVRLAMG